MKKNIDFIDLLKKYTTIDEEFIDIFFSKYEIGDDLEFHLRDEDVANYLNITLITLRKRLNNKYTDFEYFVNNVDYVKISDGKSASVTYYLNYKCFEHLAMGGKTRESAKVREYFTKLREFMVEHQHIISQAMNNKSKLNKYSNFESIYFFAVDERRDDIFKIGNTTNIIKRLQTYNTGRIYDVELKYYAIVKNRTLIEKCMKMKLQKNQVIKGREIYKIDPITLKKIIDECYCKHVSRSEHEQLFQELSELLGLYAYVKGKVNIKPFIIIGKNI